MHVRDESLVSIVLPTLNGARYLRESIDSCLAQTHQNIELIVVDGGSTDDTPEILRSYADPRIVVITQTDNTGRLPGALNLGFAHARGDYLTWMQDDDVYDLAAIETMINMLERRPDADFAYAGYWWIDENGKQLHTFTPQPASALRHTNAVGHCFLYRRGVYETIGEYDVAYVMSEDVEYWIRISLRHKMVFDPKPLYSHRWHAGSLTVRDYGRFEALRVGAWARRQWLKISWDEYRRILSSSYIEEMFASHQDGDRAHRRRTLGRGLLYDPTWLSNRGVASILVETALGDQGARAVRRLARAVGALRVAHS